MSNSGRKTLMVLAAHPADPFDCAAGTIALHTGRGDRVVVVSVTPGARSHAPKIYGDTPRDGVEQSRSSGCRRPGPAGSDLSQSLASSHHIRGIIYGTQTAQAF